jgi:hypothetical protein
MYKKTKKLVSEASKTLKEIENGIKTPIIKNS